MEYNDINLELNAEYCLQSCWQAGESLHNFGPLVEGVTALMGIYAYDCVDLFSVIDALNSLNVIMFGLEPHANLAA